MLCKKIDRCLLQLLEPGAEQPRECPMLPVRVTSRSCGPRHGPPTGLVLLGSEMWGGCARSPAAVGAAQGAPEMLLGADGPPGSAGAAAGGAQGLRAGLVHPSQRAQGSGGAWGD